MEKKLVKTVLITGTNGFVGHHFLDHVLKNTDWDVVAMVNQDINRISHSNTYLKNKDRVRIISLDLSNINSSIDDIPYVDYIVNFAGLSHVDDSIQDPINFTQSNINIMLSILNIAMKIKPKKFIHFSTDEIYGPAIDDVAHKEWSPIIPANPYSGSKAAQESILISFWRTYNIPAIIVNTMTLFGERQGVERFVPKIIKSLMEGNKIQIHTKNGIPGTRSYLHARNAADAVLFILNNVIPVSSKNSYLPDRFNIVGDAYLNNLELALKISEIIGTELNYEFIDMSNVRPGQDLKYAIDGEKLRNMGYSYPVNFENSLINTVKWIVDDDNKEFIYT